MIKASQYQIMNFSFTEKQLDYLCDILNTKHPKFILEYGCGVTTKIFDDYIKENAGTDHVSIEHDIKYKINEKCKIFPLKDDKNISTNLYEGLEDYFLSINKKFDLIVIDGPFGWEKRYKYTRLQMIDPVIFNKLEENGMFLIHDSQRVSTIKSIELLKIMLKLKGYKYVIDYIGYDEEKELMIIDFDKNELKNRLIKKFPNRKTKKIYYKIFKSIQIIYAKISPIFSFKKFCKAGKSFKSG